MLISLQLESRPVPAARSARAHRGPRVVERGTAAHVATTTSTTRAPAAVLTPDHFSIIPRGPSPSISTSSLFSRDGSLPIISPFSPDHFSLDNSPPIISPAAVLFRFYTSPAALLPDHFFLDSSPPIT